MVVTHWVPVRDVSWTLGAGSLWTSPGSSCLLTPPLIGEGKGEENKIDRKYTDSCACDGHIGMACPRDWGVRITPCPLVISHALRELIYSCKSTPQVICSTGEAHKLCMCPLCADISSHTESQSPEGWPFSTLTTSSLYIWIHMHRFHMLTPFTSY